MYLAYMKLYYDSQGKYNQSSAALTSLFDGVPFQWYVA